MKKILYYLCLLVAVVFTACEDENLPKASLDIMEAASLKAIPGDEEVTLNWAAMQEADPTGYFLSWTASSALVEGGELNIDGNVTDITIKNLKNGETYTFAVQPVYGNKGRGGKISVKVKPLSSRPAPTNLMAIPGDQTVKLKWAKPDSEALTGYELSISPGENTIAIAKDMESYEVTGLINNTEYIFTLIAIYSNGYSDAVGVTATPSEDPVGYLWSKIDLKLGELSGYVKVSNPVFSPDRNTIYIPTSTPNGHLFAVDRETGTVKWVSQIATVTYGGGAVVDANGIIYQCGTDKKIYAINPADGSKKWTCDVDAVIGAFPALSADGVLYCVTNGGTLYAINTSSGTVAWSKTVTGTGSAVAVDVSGVYVGTSTEISKYSTSGNPLWKVASALNVTERGAFAIDGTTLYATLKGDAGLVAIDMNTGTIKWTYANTGGGDAYFPIVGTDGTVYFNDKGGKKVYAINSNGALKWEKDLGVAATYCGLVLADNGKVYCATQGKTGDVYKLYGLDAATGSINFTYDSEQQFMASATIGDDKRLYIGTIGTDNIGSLLAIPIEAGPVTSTWSVRGGTIFGTNRK
jgi:outer membrane protein assembly factor BamB